MFGGIRSRTNPYRLYIGLEAAESFLVAIAYTTAVVYWVRSGRLNPLQLILLGTMVEAAYFVLQLPSGVLADVVSRRLCVVAGRGLVAAGFLMQGLSAHFAVLLTAQIPVGFGAALSFGAQEAWLADEAGETELTHVFLRATQCGLDGGIAGSILSGVLALPGLFVPFLISGGLIGGPAVALACVMPETRVATPDRPPRLGGVLRESWRGFTGRVGKARRAMVVVPGLVLLLGMMFCLGMWSEGFDRLWGAYLLRDISFPHLPGLNTALWFSVFAIVSALLSLASTQWATQRTGKLGPGSVVSTLLGLTLATAAGVIVMAASHVFAVVVVAYLFVATLRPVFSPLISGWVVARVGSDVRATALSATDMFDSAGQIAGGPVVGVIGFLTSIRVALLASAVALGPGAALLITATRRARVRHDAADETDSA